MVQQPEARGHPPQADGDDPGRDNQQRHRGKVDAEDVDFGKPHALALIAKYGACCVSASEMARMPARARSVIGVSAAAKVRSMPARWSTADATPCCTSAASASSSSPRNAPIPIVRR